MTFAVIIQADCPPLFEADVPWYANADVPTTVAIEKIAAITRNAVNTVLLVFLN